jgi:RNA polymerase sigma-54 factor
MPLLALQERIEQELEANIALEQAEPRARETEGSQEDSAVDALEQRELVVGDEPGGDEADWQRLSVLETSYRDAFDNEYSSSRSRTRAAGERDRKMDAMANVAAREESLTEQLQHQWSFAEADPQVTEAGRLIIDAIDSDGLLGTPLETIYEQNRGIPGVDVTPELLERALFEVQRSLEPPGIAARDMRECLLLQIEDLQLRDDNPEHDWDDVAMLIDEHYDDLLQNRLPRIAQHADISMERINAAMELMKRLNISPGRDLVDEGTPPIMPDVIIEYEEENDAYTARLPHDHMPRLRISRQYQKMADDVAQEKETRDFIKHNVRNAQWLIDSIRQREHTLLRVVNVVLTRQRDFFDHGPQHLKPLPMVEVADQLGIHVGTVSRAVADKWLQTPRGVVQLRRFFSGGRETTSGRDMSWDAVKATLREIIEEEDKTKPLSDEALSKALRERGIDIARRTVVKYRQQLNIPPARQRKIYT